MTPAPTPSNERDRLEALRRYQILDTAGEQVYDDLTMLASHVCGTPMAMISLVDRDRQWFKSRIGLETSETPRDVAFCAHAILDSQTFIVKDARLDERFADNPLVVKDPRVRFYAGVPLTTADGFNLGTLCVVDRKPHNLPKNRQRALEALARQVIVLLEFRRVSSDLAEALTNVKTLSGLLPICAHCKRVRDDQGYWEQVESYVSTRSHAHFSHGICPDCIQEHYGHLLNPTSGSSDALPE
jgi:GAF domain-containing protein